MKKCTLCLNIKEAIAWAIILSIALAFGGTVTAEASVAAVGKALRSAINIQDTQNGKTPLVRIKF